MLAYVLWLAVYGCLVGIALPLLYVAVASYVYTRLTKGGGGWEEEDAWWCAATWPTSLLLCYVARAIASLVSYAVSAGSWLANRRSNLPTMKVHKG